MTEEATTVPKIEIKMDGSPLSDEIVTSITDVTVEEELNLPGMFSFKFGIADFEQGEWREIDLDTFKPGNEIKISMGLDTPVELMIGEITALEPVFEEYSVMTVRGFDRMHRLRFGAERRSFTEMKDSDIASSIASDIGLTAEAEDTQTVHPYIFQNNLSNYDFLIERAKRIGYELIVDDKTLVFRGSQEDMSPELTFRYGIDIQSFSPRLKTLVEGSEIEVRGWDIKKKEVITSSAEGGSEISKMGGQETGYDVSEGSFSPSKIALIEEAVVDSADAENIAKAKYNVLLKEFINGDGKCGGNPAVRPGKTIEITGVGERFSGAYYVVSAVHSYSGGDYSTTFKVRRTGL